LAEIPATEHFTCEVSCSTCSKEGQGDAEGSRAPTVDGEGV
jgi:hypothetical protein